MFTRKELEKRITKKAEEVADLERKLVNADKELAEGRAYLQALRDMLKLCPTDRTPEAHASDSLREGSLMAKARDAIRAAGKPLHISEIALAVGADPKKKTSLAGSLNAYARKPKIFTRADTANTFGLIEFQETEGAEEINTEKEVPKNIVNL